MHGGLQTIPLDTGTGLAAAAASQAAAEGVFGHESDIASLARSALSSPIVIEAAGGASITFHRAFDSTPDPLAALETLRELGVNRVLTTGGADRAEESLTGLEKLAEAAAGRIGILPGGGINHENCRRIIEQTGAREIHVGSAVCPAGPRQEAAGLGPGGIETPAPGGETDPESVRRLRDLLG